MKPYYESDNITIYHEDCLTVMPTLPDKSIDMILCDLFLTYRTIVDILSP